MKTGKRKILSRSPLYLFVVYPLIISLLAHLAFLFYAGRIPWWGLSSPPKDRTSEAITILDVKQKGQEEPLGAEKGEIRKPAKPIHLPKMLVGRAPAKPTPDSGGTSKKEPTQDIVTGAEEPTLGSNWLKVDAYSGMRGGVGGGEGKGSGAGPTGAGGPAVTFSEYVQALRGRGLDLVIVMDATSSMDSVIKQIKLKISNLGLVLKRLVPSCRVGVVAYRDKGEAFVTKTLPLTYGISSLQQFLNGIEAVGGGDVREATDEGIKAAIEGMKWNKKSKAFILLVGDTPPHKEDIARTTAMIKGWKRETGGTLSALDVRLPAKITREVWERSYGKHGYDPELESYSALTDREGLLDAFQVFAEVGGGEAARLSNEEKVVRHMLLHIFGTQWEAYLTEVMKNL